MLGTVRKIKLFAILFFVPIIFVGLLSAQETPPPFKFTAQDKPIDDGKAIDLSWSLLDDILVAEVEKLELYRKGPDDVEYVLISEVNQDKNKYTDEPPKKPICA